MSFDPITAGLNLVNSVIDRVIPDKGAAAQAKLEVMKLQQDGTLAQLTTAADLDKAQSAVNQVEAANKSIFVAGWRPFVGWVCGAALAYSVILQPFAILVLKATDTKFVPPTLDTSLLMTVLMGMLGMGAMRTYEKTKGVASGS